MNVAPAVRDFIRRWERASRQLGGTLVMSSPLDVHAIRKHFVFPGAGRIATDNAASTQPPRELLELHGALAPQYENVHRGQSSASQCTTRRFEAAYDDIARFVGAPSRNSIVVVRNTTEAINAVMGAVLAGSGEYRSQRLGVAALFPPDTLGERSLLAHRHILSRSLIGSPPRWESGFPDGSRCY